MFRNYNTLDDVPEALREHYELRTSDDGAQSYIPKVSDDHPIIRSNRKLLREKKEAETRSVELQADLDAAKATSIPRGHVAIAKSDNELLEKVKAHGSGDEVIAKLTEHKALKEANDKRTREDSLTAVAKELSYEPEAFKRLNGLPEFEIREKDGKKSVIAKLKDDKGTITEKPAQEFIESSADFAPFLPALKADGKGVRVPGSGAGSGTPGKNAFDQAREFAKNYNDGQKQGPSITERFGITTPAA